MQFVRNLIYAFPVNKPTQELILEILRWLVFVALSAVVTALLELLVDIEPTTTVTMLTIALRALDKWLFIRAKDQPAVKSKIVKGLTF